MDHIFPLQYSDSPSALYSFDYMWTSMDILVCVKAHASITDTKLRVHSPRVEPWITSFHCNTVRAHLHCIHLIRWYTGHQHISGKVLDRRSSSLERSVQLSSRESTISNSPNCMNSHGDEHLVYHSDILYY